MRTTNNRPTARLDGDTVRLTLRATPNAATLADLRALGFARVGEGSAWPRTYRASAARVASKAHTRPALGQLLQQLFTGKDVK